MLGQARIFDGTFFKKAKSMQQNHVKLISSGVNLESVSDLYV